MSTDITESVRVENPLQLLQQLIDRGTDPVALGKMMDLAERWQENHAKAAFATAMNDCQKRMPVVIKNAMNNGKRYANLEAVNNTLKPVYTEEGFSIAFGEEDSPVAGEKRIIADVQHVDGHCKRYHIDVPLDGVGARGGASAMNAIQAEGSTISYAKRYLVCMIFNVTIADEDNDGAAPFVGLDDNQTVTLNDLIDDIRTATADESAFRRWLDKVYEWVGELQKSKVESLSDVRSNQFDASVSFLNKKIAHDKKGKK